MTNPGLSGGRALLELAERVEKATGPDRALDADIAAALHVKQLTYQSPEWIKDPEFTASLDAAMTLVPEGYHIALAGEDGGTWSADVGSLADPFRAKALATPALALVAAALRARAADTPSVKP